MSITTCEALSAGNAVRLTLVLPVGASSMRILRRTTDSFIGPNDPSAVLVTDNEGADFHVDASASLINGQTYYYRCYDFVGSSFVDQFVTFQATPVDSYIPDALDAQELVRDRLQLGLAGAILHGRLQPPSGAIQVLTAPFALADNTTFPAVSVHLESTGPTERGIGDEIEDFYDPTAPDWIGTEGWFARTALNIVGVAQNADERIQLRKVIRQVIQANLPVFAGQGMTLIEFNQSDSEQFSENNVPLYLTNGSFSCVTPSFVRDFELPISRVTVNPGVQTSGMSTVDFYGDRDA